MMGLEYKEIIVVVVGLVLLYIYGRHHFNTPDYPLTLTGKRHPAPEEGVRAVKQSRMAQLRAMAPPMFTIPRDRYRQYARYYIGGLWLLFLLFVFAPEVVTQYRGIGADELPGTVIDRVIWTLFALTGFLSSFPGLKEWDMKTLRALHKRAAIPDDTRATAAQLFDADFNPTDEMAHKIIQQLGNQFVRVSEGHTFKGRLEEDWFRVNYVWNSIQTLLRERRYRAFNIRFEDDIDETEEIYVHQQSQLDKHKKAEIRELPDDIANIDQFLEEADEERFETLKVDRQKLEFEIESLFYRLCTLSSLLAYASEPTIDKIDVRFKTLGFSVKIKPLPLIDTDAILKTCIALAVIILVPSVAYHMLGDKSGGSEWVPQSFPEAVGWSALGVFLHGVAVLIALSMKRFLFKRRLIHQPQADPQVNRFSRNMLVAALTAVATLLFFIGLNVLAPMIDGADAVSWKVLSFAVVPAVTAYFTAVYIDRIHEHKLVPLRLLVSQVVVMVVVTAFACLFSLVNDVADAPEVLVSFLLYAVTTAALVGLTVSVIFPRVYRRSVESRQYMISGEHEERPGTTVLLAAQ